jgi:6-phosphogluconolactonase/glucosamine-6-phosphate isomerase/deaminase
MEFIRIASPEEGVRPLAESLLAALKSHGHVAWFVSGGSNIPISVSVMQTIPDELSKRLSIFLSDERFGPVGHPDSNFQQLMDAGFDPKGARVVPVLVPAVGLDETVGRYDSALEDLFDTAEVIIGQFGLGADGHICGILPHTPAVTSSELVTGYATETYTRITTTPKALEHFTTVYVFTFGDTKRTALINLQEKDLPVDEQPAQVLKQLPEVYIYSDQVERVERVKEEET